MSDSKTVVNGQTVPDTGSMGQVSDPSDIAAISSALSNIAAAIGVSTGSKFGAMGATPVIRPVGAAQAQLTITGGTFGLNSAAGVTNLVASVNKILTDLTALGLIKGAA